MKKVFSSTSELAHTWAHQLQQTGTNSGRSFYFEGDTIYSYGAHFPIAKIVNGAVLFTTRSYSNTTAKHISIVRNSVSHKNLIFCYNPQNSHESNFNEYLREAESIVKNLTNARKPEKYLSELSYINGRANKYAEFFGIALPEKLQAVFNISNKDQYITYRENAVKFEQAEKLKKEKLAKNEHAKALKKWRNFESYTIYQRNGFDYLRLNSDSDNFETTQGVKIPVIVGRRFYIQLKNALSSGNIDNLKILDFTVYELTKKHVKIGCHCITWTEIETAIKTANENLLINL